MSQERRHFSRIAFHTEARLTVGERAVPVEVLDLSLKGALARLTEGTVPTGQPALLQIRLDEMGTLISMQGLIAHVEGEQVGLRCQEIDLDSITHLRRLVELNLGDEALLERELHHLAGA